MERYGVSRAVFREAVRLLEFHQIATMRRGPGGGLFVAAPSAAAVSDVVALYLASRGTGIAALAELRVRVELALVDLVIDRLDASGSAALDEAVEVEEGDADPDVAIHNLHAAIAGLAENRALELVALVLIRLTQFHQFRKLSARESAKIRRDVNRTHVGIAARSRPATEPSRAAACGDTSRCWPPTCAERVDRGDRVKGILKSWTRRCGTRWGAGSRSTGPRTSPSGSGGGGWPNARLVAPSWPEPYGRGYSVAQGRVVTEELAAAGVIAPPVGNIGLGLAGPTLLEHGTEEQRRHLPAAAPQRRGGVVPALQ